MRREKIVNILLCLAFLAMSLFIFGYLKSTKSKLKKRSEEVQTSILRTFLATRGNFPAKFNTFGTVRTVHKLDLKAEVSGKVSDLHPQFLLGGEIPAGAILLTLDQTDLRLSLKQAEASVDLSKAQLETLRQESKNVQASLKLQRGSLELSQNELKRHEQMYAEKTISRQTLENSQRRNQSQELAVLSLENQAKLFPSRILQAKSNLKIQNIRLLEAKNRLAKAFVRAPFRGRVASKNISEGQFLNIGGIIGQLINLDTLEIHTPIPSSEIPWLIDEISDSAPLNQDPKSIAGKTVQLEFLAPISQSGVGTINRLGADLNNNTRSLMAYIGFNNRPLLNKHQKRDLLPKILPGSFCRINFEGKLLKDVLKVPRSSLKLSQIQVVRNNKLEILSVDIIRDEGEQVYIRADVAPNEQIVAYYSERNSAEETVQTAVVENI